jgi:hypothetical protein
VEALRVWAETHIEEVLAAQKRYDARAAAVSEHEAQIVTRLLGLEGRKAKLWCFCQRSLKTGHFDRPQKYWPKEPM